MDNKIYSKEEIEKDKEEFLKTGKAICPECGKREVVNFGRCCLCYACGYSPCNG